MLTSRLIARNAVRPTAWKTSSYVQIPNFLFGSAWSAFNARDPSAASSATQAEPRGHVHLLTGILPLQRVPRCCVVNSVTLDSWLCLCVWFVCANTASFFPDT